MDSRQNGFYGSAWRESQRIGFFLALLLVIGCASTKPRTAHSAIEAEAKSTAEYQPETALAATSPVLVEETPNDSIQRVSAENGLAAPAIAITDESMAGKTFLSPPETPAAPEAIALNQNLAPAGEPLTLEMLESLACENNPTLLQAQAQIEGELGKAIEAGLWPNPRLNYVHEQIGVEGTTGEFVGGTVQQRIITGRKLDLSRAKYLARSRSAEWHALEQQYRVLNDVRRQYFRARAQYELVQLQRELLKNAEDKVLTAREQFNVGQANRVGVHMANVALQRTRLELLRAENEFHQSLEVLSSLVGVDLPTAPLGTPLEGDLTPIDYDESLARLIAQSPQIQAARQKLESDRITIRRETVQPVPDLVLEGGVGRNFEASDNVAMASIGLDIPIFDWNQGTIRQAEADYARQQGELRRLELMLKQHLASTYSSYLTALQHATNYAEIILPEASAAYELQLHGYDEDRLPWTSVLETQKEYFQLRAEYIQHLRAWRESEVLIMGFLLHGGLNAPTGPTPPGHIDSVPKPR